MAAVVVLVLVKFRVYVTVVPATAEGVEDEMVVDRSATLGVAGATSVLVAAVLLPATRSVLVVETEAVPLSWPLAGLVGMVKVTKPMRLSPAARSRLGKVTKPVVAL
jgi:hypothetical protein